MEIINILPLLWTTIVCNNYSISKAFKMQNTCFIIICMIASGSVKSGIGQKICVFLKWSVKFREFRLFFMK